MKRQMNKQDRQMSYEETVKALASGNHGTLSVIGDEGYPYATPVNYVYEDGKIYIHSAKYGYKVECIEKCDKVCFSAIISAEVEQSRFTAAFESVVATGRIKSINDEGEKRSILEKFIYKMAPDYIEGGMKFVSAAIDKTLLLCIDIEEMTGKQSKATSYDA